MAWSFFTGSYERRPPFEEEEEEEENMKSTLFQWVAKALKKGGEGGAPSSDQASVEWKGFRSLPPGFRATALPSPFPPPRARVFPRREERGRESAFVKGERGRAFEISFPSPSPRSLSRIRISRR